MMRQGWGFKPIQLSRFELLDALIPVMYAAVMTDLIERAVATMKALPPERRDEIARLVIALAGDTELVELTPEEDAALARSEAAAARGEFASDSEIAAIWAKHGR